jgi:succinate dehydrogenase / fumarate reductase cytochrome b subunit
MSSLFKKYLMALTGIVLIGFVFVHMLGNLQVLLGQEAINAYAHTLQSLPAPILWGSRLFLFACVFLHAVTAYMLIKENRAARPIPNAVEKTKRTGLSSLRMGLTGSIILAFVVFHLLHFTTRHVFPEYRLLKTTVGSPDGVEQIHDVYTMVLAGFSSDWISAAYVFCMFLLCRHLAHGVSSTFQSLGLRAESWSSKLDFASKTYAWVIFVGFSVVPLSVLADKHGLISFYSNSSLITADLLKP